MSTQNNHSSKPRKQPADWLEGLKDNFSSDATSGFMIFLLALPLSLGIAKASDFPAVMGLVTAIIGGIVVTFFTGSKLAIKGPAAGLIVIVAGAVAEFGGGVEGWQMAAGVMVVAGLVQIAFGVLKLGRLADFFPLSAIHGMLAAIGLIIIAKQIPALLNVDPAMTKGHGPLGLFVEIPHFIANMNPGVTLIGLVSLAVMIFWPKFKNKWAKRIPAPLLVLLFAIPAGLAMNLQDAPAYTLLKVGNILDKVAINANAGGLAHAGIFVKYVVMIALVGSLESLLTVKAIDIMDPFQRKSDTNQDLIAVGIGNTLAALVGGLPMISEVARSSANVRNGARTRWANFFHGIFLLVFAVAAYPVLEMIPNAALAAMLIAVGINLAHPKEFLSMYKIGSEQLAIFLVTIFVTLLEDLLLGIAAGIILKIIIHLVRGASFRSLFRSAADTHVEGDNFQVTIHHAALFSNYLGIKKELDAIPNGKQVQIILADDIQLVDHSFMENLVHFQHDYEQTGGHVEIVGLDQLLPISAHPLAARKRPH
ncbi:MAG: SulP family inorganic anion transporter [Saprospiraceae bacterium]